MNSVSVKVRYNDDTRRFQLQKSDSWEVLKQRLITTFGVVDIRVKYTDEESDEISLDSQEELNTAVEFAKDSGGVLRLRVEDLSLTKSGECTSPVASFEDFNASRLMSKKIWKNEKKFKKERKRYYAALAEEIGESRKEAAPKTQNFVTSPCSNEQEVPAWFSTAMDKLSNDTIQKILEHLKGAIPTKPEDTHTPMQYLHYDVECDGCGSTIVGVRYKCGNCLDYDLCERCEPLDIHYQDHVFIKLKRPTYVGNTDALLPRLLYTRPTTLHRVDIDVVTEDKMDAQLISDEVKVSLESSNPELDSITEDTESSISSLKGHRKCLDGKFVADINLPDNSFVFLGVPFSKTWLVKNAGSKQWRNVKLVHKEGHVPVMCQVALPDLQPGEETEVTVNYTPIGVDVPENKLIISSWRFVHKDKTMFGDELWLSVFGLNNKKDGTNSEQFDIVESPTVSLVSISTAGVSGDEDTINSRGYLEDKDDDASSVASDDSFVVVIPDCFDPGVPLLGNSPTAKAVAPPTNGKQEPPAEQQQQQVNVEELNINLMTFDEPVAPPTQPTNPVQGNSEPRPQENITTVKQTNKGSPQRPSPPTPFQMLSNPRTHILGRSPWQVGAAFIDSTMHHIDQHVGKPSGMYASRPSAPEKMETEGEKLEASKNDDTAVTAGNDTEDDEFQDCTFDMLEPAEPRPKPSRTVHFDTSDTVISQAANISTKSPQLYPKLPDYHPSVMAPADNSSDVTRLLNANAGPYQPPPPWTPREPETPMQQLINLGFGNRQINAQLLHKHGNNIQAVVNELLDAQS